MDRYNHSVQDAKIMVSKNCPLIGEHVAVNWEAQKIIVATIWPAKNTSTTQKRAQWPSFLLSNWNKHGKMQCFEKFKRYL